MRLRLAAEVDAYTVAAIQVAAWRKSFESILPTPYLQKLNVETRAKQWADFIEAKNGAETWLLDVNLRPVAFFGLDFLTMADGEAEISGFYMAPWFQSVLGPPFAMRGALSRLRQRGIKRTHLWTFTRNDRARAFFAASGFYETGEVQAGDFGGHEVQLTKMQREIAQ